MLNTWSGKSQKKNAASVFILNFFLHEKKNNSIAVASLDNHLILVEWNLIVCAILSETWSKTPKKRQRKKSNNWNIMHATKMLGVKEHLPIEMK